MLEGDRTLGFIDNKLVYFEILVESIGNKRDAYE